MKSLAAGAIAIASLAVACGSTSSSQTTTQVAVPTNGPGGALARFVRAAAAGESRQIQTLVSASTRRRGYSTAALERKLKPFTDPNVELAEQITGRWAVASVTTGGLAYAAALRREHGRWKVELGDPIRIRPLRPRPGEQVKRNTQLAGEADAPAALDQAGLWLDGNAIQARGGGPSPRALTMYTDRVSLDLGSHTLVVFASAGNDAAARAWSFTAVGNLSD